MTVQPVDIPSLDELVSDPAKVATLPPETAQALLIALSCLQPVLIQRALMIGSQNGQGKPIKNNALTAEQVATILNVKPSFVYDMARQNKLKSYKVGKYIRFKEAAVQDYMAKGGA